MTPEHGTTRTSSMSQVIRPNGLKPLPPVRLSRPPMTIYLLIEYQQAGHFTSNVYPPAIAPTIIKGSFPLNTFSGSTVLSSTIE